MDVRQLLAIGTGAGIEMQGSDLVVTVTRVRPSGAEVLGTTAIRGFRERPAGEWGAEYARFLAAHGASHLTATVALPRRDLIVRLVTLPGVAGKDLAAAIDYQIDSLHPWGEEDVVVGWAPLGAPGAVLVGIARREVLAAHIQRFAEAGVAAGCFTFAAAAFHSARRIFAIPAESLLALGATPTGAVEAYGESPSRPVFSAEFDLPLERAAALAAAELRLDPGVAVVPLEQALPAPRQAGAGDSFSRGTTSYAASLAGACPRLAPAANLLPLEFRATNSRAMFVP
ncbi:MAG: hypothetical protein ACRD96_04405, partial [Bryobacteraceae bacterium]